MLSLSQKSMSFFSSGEIIFILALVELNTSVSDLRLFNDNQKTLTRNAEKIKIRIVPKGVSIFVANGLCIILNQN